MLGYDISWAAFNIIEVMSSTKFTSKRIGYLAAAQSFRADMDVLMLTTNMIKKVCLSAGGRWACLTAARHRTWPARTSTRPVLPSAAWRAS